MLGYKSIHKSSAQCVPCLPPPLLQLFKLGTDALSQQTSAVCECARTVRRRWTALSALRGAETSAVAYHVASHGDLARKSAPSGAERAGLMRCVSL